MTLKEYRLSKRLTQTELAAEISKDIPGIDRALISKIETGLCEPSSAIRIWLFKACAQASKELKGQTWATLRETEKKALKTDLQAQIYEMLEKADRSVSRNMLRIRTGRSDRQIRKAISEMRAAGILIVTTSSGKGYWLAQTDNDLRLLKREYQSRLITCNKILKAISTAAPDQYVMEVSNG